MQWWIDTFAKKRGEQRLWNRRENVLHVERMEAGNNVRGVESFDIVAPSVKVCFICVNNLPRNDVFKASDWKDGHKSNCRPFNDKKFTLTCKPTYGGYASGMNIDLFTRRLVGQPDGEGRRKEVIRKWECDQGLRRRIKGPPPKKETSDSLMKLSTSVPTGFIGKTITVKAIIPSAIRPPPLTERQLESLSTFGLDPSLVAKLVDEEEADDKHEVVIYDKTKRFSCKILPDGQPEEHARLEGIIREKGLMGVKAFFVAELESADSLKIKIGDMLAVQAW